MYVTQWVKHVQAKTAFPNVICELILQCIGIDLKCVLIMMLAQSKSMEIYLPLPLKLYRPGLGLIIRVEIPERRIDNMFDPVAREAMVMRKSISMRTSREARRSRDCHVITRNIDCFWAQFEIGFLTSSGNFRRLGYESFEADLETMLLQHWKDKSSE